MGCAGPVDARVEEPTARVPTRGLPRHRPEHWPLLLLLGGYPLWWLLGLDQLLPLLLAVPMGLAVLRRQAPLRAWRGTGAGWWALFLVWALLGLATVGSDAPAAVPGTDGGGLLVLGYRLAWYVACGVVLLWVAGLDRRTSDTALLRLGGWLFLVCVAGGWLGLLAPDFEVTSMVEHLLPGSLRSNAFVASLVHPEAADVQSVLGSPAPRPKAPFPFTNTWGAVLTLSLVLLVGATAGLRPGRRAMVLAAAAALAVVPVVASLNRGLWATLAGCLIGLLVLRARRGRLRSVLALLATAVVVVGCLSVSPLGETYQQRLDSPHSNGRREQLLRTTLVSVTTGSPVVGFGGTRDVQGSFASITGAATPECPACGVPPLGTQGQLWMVVYSQGWVGLALFLGLLLSALRRSWRCRTRAQAVCAFTVGAYLLQMPVYDTLGLPLLLVMVTVGMVLRERRTSPGGPPAHGRAPAPPARVAGAVLVGGTVVGAVLGLLVTTVQDRPTTYRSTTSILLVPTPSYLDPGPAPGTAPVSTLVVEEPRPTTVDTEAALLISERSLTRAAGRTSTTPSQLRVAIRVSAPPRSQVLDLSVDASSASLAATRATAVSRSYLRERRRFLEARRADSVASLRQALRELSALDPALEESREALAARIDRLLLTERSVGDVVRERTEEVRRQDEIPSASGAGLGLLAALGLLRLARRRSGRPPAAPARPPAPAPVQHRPADPGGPHEHRLPTDTAH